MKNELDILIIGGGLAGLSAAVNLKQQGLNVLLLEETDRLGGRVKTTEINGLKIELGAEWIGRRHNRMQDLCNQYRLTLLAHEVNPCLRLGEPHNTKDILTDLYDKRPQLLSKFASWLKQQGEYSKEATLRECLYNCGLDEQQIIVEKMMAKFIYGEDVSRLKAADVYQDIKEGVVEKEDSFWIEGGNQLLVKNLAQILGEDNFLLNSKVTAIRQGRWVEIITTNQSFKAEKIVVALPPQTILGINWLPNLPSELIDTIRKIKSVHVAKVVSIFPERFWGDDNFGMFQPQPGAPELIYHSTLGQDGRKGALTAFAVGKNAVDICRLDEEERKRVIYTQLSKLFGRKVPHIIHSEVANWESAYSVYTKSSFDQTKRSLHKPWINAYFAGEYIPQFFSEQGYMEGAISSGQEAANLVANSGCF